MNNSFNAQITFVFSCLYYNIPAEGVARLSDAEKYCQQLNGTIYQHLESNEECSFVMGQVSQVN
jgi:hypothetical protein